MVADSGFLYSILALNYRDFKIAPFRILFTLHNLNLTLQHFKLLQNKFAASYAYLVLSNN